MAQYPFGGVIWDYVQYLLGFRDLGHEVWYLEDSGVWPYDPIQFTYTEDCSHNVLYLKKIMEEFGFQDRWIYRNGANGEFHGAGETVARELLKNGDLLVDVSGAGCLRDYDLTIRHKMFLDGDPMFTQIGLCDPEKKEHAERVKSYESHFSFGLHIGASDCLVPTAGIDWKPTLQPIALDYWPVQTEAPLDRFTTVMNWASYAPKEWEGKPYGQKDLEFQRFIQLPQKTKQKMVLAMGKGPGNQRPTEKLESIGWTILEPDQVVPDHHTYRDFLRTSAAEWSIAKHGYVASQSGWFSCRTACYLALGRPAVVQDTGWSRHLPHLEGVLPFTTEEEALSQIDSIRCDYKKHQKAARAFAEEFLDAKKVCQKLISDAF